MRSEIMVRDPRPRLFVTDSNQSLPWSQFSNRIRVDCSGLARVFFLLIEEPLVLERISRFSENVGAPHRQIGRTVIRTNVIEREG